MLYLESLHINTHEGIYMQPLRSLIFVPGNRPDMLEKSREFSADVIVADLEDSVPASEKDKARSIVANITHTLANSNRKVMVRINSFDTGLAFADLSEVIGPHIYGISVGKITSADDIRQYSHMLEAIESSNGIEKDSLKIIPWIENTKAIMNITDITRASSRLLAVAFGAEDYTDDLRIERTDMGNEVYFARSVVAVAGHAAQLPTLDGPYVKFKDTNGLSEDITTALQLGYKGKFAIHPSQIEPINSMFSPQPDALKYAIRVIKAWEEAETSGRGSTSLDGRMIDVPVVKRARNLLTTAKQLGIYIG